MLFFLKILCVYVCVCICVLYLYLCYFVVFGVTCWSVRGGCVCVWVYVRPLASTCCFSLPAWPPRSTSVINALSKYKYKYKYNCKFKYKYKATTIHKCHQRFLPPDTNTFSFCNVSLSIVQLGTKAMSYCCGRCFRTIPLSHIKSTGIAKDQS